MSIWIVSAILVVALYLLVYAPAGYRFSDYLKLGIPLNFIVLILGTLLIPILWPQ